MTLSSQFALDFERPHHPRNQTDENNNQGNIIIKFINVLTYINCIKTSS